MVHKLLWEEVESALRFVDPGFVVKLKRSAEETLHKIPPLIHTPSDEGIAGEVMWHRAKVPGAADDRPDGLQNYFLFYRNKSDEEFEILHICSIYEIASRYASQMGDLP